MKQDDQPAFGDFRTTHSALLCSMKMIEQIGVIYHRIAVDIHPVNDMISILVSKFKLYYTNTSFRRNLISIVWIPQLFLSQEAGLINFVVEFSCWLDYINNAK